MDVFDLRNSLIEDHAGYTHSFIKIADDRIIKKVDAAPLPISGDGGPA